MSSCALHLPLSARAQAASFEQTFFFFMRCLAFHFVLFDLLGKGLLFLRLPPYIRWPSSPHLRLTGHSFGLRGRSSRASSLPFDPRDVAQHDALIKPVAATAFRPVLFRISDLASFLDFFFSLDIFARKIPKCITEDAALEAESYIFRASYGPVLPGAFPFAAAEMGA